MQKHAKSEVAQRAFKIVAFAASTVRTVCASLMAARLMHKQDINIAASTLNGSRVPSSVVQASPNAKVSAANMVVGKANVRSPNAPTRWSAGLGLA